MGIQLLAIASSTALISLRIGRVLSSGGGGHGLALATVVPTSGVGEGLRCSSRPSSLDGRPGNAPADDGVEHWCVANSAGRRPRPSWFIRRVASCVGLLHNRGMVCVALPGTIVIVLSGRMDCTTVPVRWLGLDPRRGIRRGTCSAPILKRGWSLPLPWAGDFGRCWGCLRCGFRPIAFWDVPVRVLALRTHLGEFLGIPPEVHVFGEGPEPQGGDG